MFRFQFHEDPGYLETELAGFWTLDDVAAFDRGIGQFIAKYGPRLPNFPMLSDQRSFAVQSAEVTEAFAAYSSAAAERHPGLVAIVIGSVLSRIQTNRVIDGRRTRRFFDNMDEARACVEAAAHARTPARRRA